MKSIHDIQKQVSFRIGALQREIKPVFLEQTCGINALLYVKFMGFITKIICTIGRCLLLTDYIQDAPCGTSRADLSINWSTGLLVCLLVYELVCVLVQIHLLHWSICQSVRSSRLSTGCLVCSMVHLVRLVLQLVCRHQLSISFISSACLLFCLVRLLVCLTLKP